MARPTTRKPKTKSPRPVEAEEANGLPLEENDSPAPEAGSAPERQETAQAVEAPEMPREEHEEADDSSAAKEAPRSDVKGREKENGNKDRVAANSINIAKLQAMSMADLNGM